MTRLLLPFAALLLASAAQASPPVIVAREGVDGIETLEWLSEKHQAVDSPPAAIIRGRYPLMDWKLQLRGRDIPRSALGVFALKVALPGASANLELVAISPDGKKRQKERIRISRVADTGAITPPRFSASLGANFTLLSYRDTVRTSFTEMALTAKGGITFPLIRPRWDFGLSFYVTAVPLRSTSADKARFLGVNFRVGYAIPSSGNWSLSLMGGMYYTTMIVPGGAFGFRNMAGPQLFPVLRRRLSLTGRSLIFYAKLSPVSDGFNLLNLSNREIAAGSAITVYKSTSLTLDVANLVVTISGVRISSTSASLGASVGF
jgi:hypothetical protein